MKWILAVSVYLLQWKLSDAQLMSPSEAVCPGNCVIFSCRQTASLTRWDINLQSGTLQTSVQGSQVGSIATFVNDPGFHFEVHVVSNSSNSLTSELQVTAVRELNGVPVECSGISGNYMSTIQVVSVDPPAAPSGVMTIYDQFTKTGASISVTWSTSSGADNYTIKVTPPMSNFTITATSLQLIIVYNVNYSVNITAQNCAGSNSTIVPLIVAGCSPPSPPSNGSVNEYLSGSTGASLTFQCNTGYIPHEQVTSTCLENGSWMPIPQCVLADCGTPIVASGVVIEPFNSTQFDATITFHCDEGLIPQTLIKVVCGSTGVWNPDPAFHLCVNQSSVFCSAPVVPTNAHHISNQSNSVYLVGTKVTFLCSDNIISLTTICHSNGSWGPNPAELECEPSSSASYPSANSSQVIITAVVCSFVFFFIGILVGVLCHRWTTVFTKPCRNLKHRYLNGAHTPTGKPGLVAPVYEEVASDSPSGQNKIIELEENVAYGPI